MNEEEFTAFKDKIIDNIFRTLQRDEDNPVMEHYNARNLECYLRSLEILERIGRKK